MTRTKDGFIIPTLLGIISLSLILVASFTLKWRIYHDSAIMLYYAFLIEHCHYIPYRDFFDMNMPGSHMINYLVVRLFGYSDLAFRAADLSILSLILLAGYLWLKKFGRLVGWFGAVAFGLVYFIRGGPELSFQREMFIIFPVILILHVSTSFPGLDIRLRAGITGMLFGAASMIKPHSIIAFPVVLAFQLVEYNKIQKKNEFAGPKVMAAIISSALGFAVPVLTAVVYLTKNGAMQNFSDTATNIWPIYATLNNSLHVNTGADRFRFLYRNFKQLGGNSIWLYTALAGVYISLFRSKLDDELKRQVILLALVTFCYSVYPLLSGQSFYYHWLIFIFLIIQTSSLCLVESTYKPIIRYVVPAFLFFVLYRYTDPVGQYTYHCYLSPPKIQRADEIAAFLKANLKDGERVQPLDWTGGSVHAMLMAKAQPATSFIGDFQFYLNPSDPYIQGLRDQFIREMSSAKPRFIIQVTAENKPFINGKDSTSEFTQLVRMLSDNYRIVKTARDYIIYERNEPSKHTQIQ